MAKIKLAEPIRFASATNPLGLHIGQPVKAKRTCTITYDGYDNRNLFYDDRPRGGYIIGIVKKALGKYIKGYSARWSFDEFDDYGPARLQVSKYVRLYECRSQIDQKSFFVHPDDIQTHEPA